MKDISTILARTLLKATEKEEQETLERWKEKSEDNTKFLNVLLNFWNYWVEEHQIEFNEPPVKRLIARMNGDRRVKRSETIGFWIRRFAAVFLLALAISGLSIYTASRIGFFSRDAWIQVSTDSGQRSKLTLPDGTLVWLNSETILKYKQVKDFRKVELAGEAYFEVTHAKNHPFIVVTGETELKVLGTKFNVSHYRDSRITEAALLSGKISVKIDEIGKMVELKPGEKIVYDSASKMLSQSVSKVQNEISWKQGILTFENAPFNNLIQELERYYGVKFIYDPSAFNQKHYTGSIDNLEISRVLEFINLTIPIAYEIKNKTIVLKLK